MTGLPRLFLDASVWIAAAGSDTGASALILLLCQKRQALAVCTTLVLREAERNIRDKLGDDALLRFYKAIAALDLERLQPPLPAEIAHYARIIVAKDAHVLAAAERGHATVLLTLDRKRFFTPSIRRTRLPFAVKTPGDYLRQIASPDPA